MNSAEVLFLFILFIIIVSFFTTKVKKRLKKAPVQKEDKYIPLPDMSEFELPSKIEEIYFKNLKNIVEKIFDSYLLFDYRSMSLEELEKKEWHSWQVSMLLMLIKKKETIFLNSQKVVFHDFLLKSNENSIKSLYTDVLKKYYNYVDIRKPKDKLCKEYIWSNKEVSIIFYYLINYKKYS